MNIVFLTNILNPYRINFFDLIAKEAKEENFNFHVIVMTGEKPDRPTWHYEELKRDYTILMEDRTFLIRGIYLHFNRQVISILKKLQPDIIVCSGSYLQPSVLKTLLHKKRLGYKVYLWSESHLNEMRSYGKLLLNIREKTRRYILRCFDGFLFAGEYSKEYVDKYKNPNADLYLLHNTVDDHYFYSKANELRSQRALLREKYGFSPDQFVFFSPVRLSYEKGLGKFWESAAYIDSGLKSKISFAVAGTGAEQKNWQQIADRTGFNVKFLGMKNQQEIVELYVSADCFFLPSTSDPNPLSVIEASWTGLPLLLSKNVGNWPETVKQAKNGFVFDYDHPDEIENIISDLITTDEDWRRNAASISLGIMRKEYQADFVAQSLVKHFWDIL